MIRLGAVGYLNARPHVYGLERSPRFSIRFDVPSKCAELLHENAIDVGLIPSIEYLRGSDYRIVPDIAIASRGPVASVALYTTRTIRDIRSIALDTSSRSSVALMKVLCAREFRISPRFEASGPDLESMLDRCDAAVIIGDRALFLDHHKVRLKPDPTADKVRLKPDPTADKVRLKPDPTPDKVRLKPDPTYTQTTGVHKIDLGEVWTRSTGLPFVYAFWAGRSDALTPEAVRALQEARERGVAHVDEIARAYVAEPDRQTIAAYYLRDNIKYDLGPDERAGLELFYQYAAEAEVVPRTQELRFYSAR